MNSFILKLIVVATMGLVGCSSKQSASTPTPEPTPTPVTPNTPNVVPDPSNNNNTPVDPVTGDAGPVDLFAKVGLTSGGVSKFTPDSISAFEDYKGASTNNPTNFQIYVDMKKVGGQDFFEGEIRIAYLDSDYAGKYIAGAQNKFDTGTGTNPSNHPDSWIKSKHRARFSKWYNHGGQPYFKAFVQDTYGSLILYIDRTQDNAALGGEIWYHNFAFGVCNQQAPWYCNTQGPNLRCWDISVGPYDCRDFLVTVGGHKEVNPDYFIAPPNNNPRGGIYKRLGTFDVLNKAKAFKGM